MSRRNSDLYKFSDFHLDTNEKALLKDGIDVPITPKAFQLLRILVENHGKVVKKDELISRIWENSFVEEGNLAFTARLLRKVLNDDAKHPIFVETVPRKGYRFIADVSKYSVSDTSDFANGVPKTRWPQLRSHLLWGVLTVLIVSVLVGVSYFVQQTVVSDSIAPILSSSFMAERLTSTGNAFQAVISPNGKLAAYTDAASGKWSLWLRRLETAENIQILPPSEASYGGLVFSRDGNSLFFARSGPGTRHLSIYRMNAFGGVPTKILENTQGWFSISPDDTRISFVRCLYAREDFCSLYTANVNGSNELKIVTRPEPTRIADNQFAPDGKSLAFAAGQSRTGSDEFGLFCIDLGSGMEREITSRRFFNIKYLKWLSDGEGLLLSARHSLAQKFSIWTVHSTSGATTQLTSDDANFSGLSLDEKSEALVATKVDNDFAIYLGHTKEGGSRELVAGTSASFTPHGSIVYESPDRDIWTIDPDGSNKRQLTNGSFTEVCPILSPDGQVIFFSSNRSGVNQVWRMNIDGSDQRQLTRTEGGYPSFVTPQGEWLYYRAGRTNSFRKIRTDGSYDQSAAEIDKFAGAFSPDGRLLAYFDHESSGASGSLKIAIRALLDQTIVQIMSLRQTKGELTASQWSSDSRSILYVVREAGIHRLWRWRLNQSKPELLMDLGIEPVERFAVSPDGLSIATVQGKWLHDAYFITGFGNRSYHETGLSQ